MLVWKIIKDRVVLRDVELSSCYSKVVYFGFELKYSLSCIFFRLVLESWRNQLVPVILYIMYNATRSLGIY